MRAQDDEGLTRESLKGLYIFLYSEAARHEDDIVKIEDSLTELAQSQSFSRHEIQDMRRQSTKYVKF